jgi:hypothetical protein
MMNTMMLNSGNTTGRAQFFGCVMVGVPKAWLHGRCLSGYTVIDPLGFVLRVAG